MKQFCTWLKASISLLLSVSIIFICSSCIGHRQNQKTRIRSKDLTQATTNQIPSPWSSKKIGELTLEEAQGAYQYYKQNNRIPHLAAVLERMILLTPDQEQLEPLLNELIDIKIELALLEEAEALLEEYCLLYPGNPKTPKKRIQKISVQLQQISSSERDITKAEKTLEEGYILLEEQHATSRLSEQELTTLIGLMRIAHTYVVQKYIDKIMFYLNRFAYTERPQALETAWKNMQKLLEVLTQEKEASLLGARDKDQAKQMLTTLSEQATRSAAERTLCMNTMLNDLQHMIGA